MGSGAGYALIAVALSACATSSAPKALSDTEILDVLRSHHLQILDCIRKQREADPTVLGLMTVKLVITQEGQASQVVVEPERYANSVGGRCVVTEAESWMFPQFTGPAQPIDFPVELH